MASITQDPNPTNAPDYTNVSRGTDRAQANTSTGQLFSNLANVGSGAVKAAYAYQTEHIKEGLQEGIDKIRSGAGVDSAADLAAAGGVPTQVKGEANLFGDTSNVGVGAKPGKGNPAGVTRLGENLGGLQDAYQQGKLSESYYNARLLALVRETKNQYPGFKDEIDQVVSSTTGINPANALVRSLRMDMDAAERARVAGQTKDESYMAQHAQYVSDDMRNRWAAGDRSPLFVAQFKVQAAGRQADAVNVEQATHRLDLQIKQGTATDNDYAKTARLSLTTYTNHAVSDLYSSVGGADGLLQKIKAHGDKPWSPAEQEDIRGGLGQFKLRLMSGIDNILSQPQFAQLDESKKTAMREEVLKRYQTIEDAALNKDTGTLTADARYNTAIENADVRHLFDTNDFYRKLHSVSKTTGAAAPTVIGQMLQTDAGAKALNDSTKTLLTANMAELSNGTAGSLKQQAQRQQQASETIPGFKDPAAYKVHVDSAVQGLVQSKDIHESENFATAMFGKGNVGFLSVYSPNSQQRVYRALTSPAVDLKMVELGKGNPALYKSYRDWVVSYGFQSQIKRSLDQINDTHTDPGTYADIHLNPNTNQFEVAPKPGTEKQVRDQIAQGHDPLRVIRSAIDDVNENMRIIAPILKREGGDPAQEIGKVLQSNGWDPNAPKRPTFVQSLGNAISGAYKKVTGESNQSPDIPTAQPLEYRLDNLPKGRVIRPEGEGHSDNLINLDTGTLQDISSKTGALKKVIRGAEAGGDYNNVFGTSQAIPVTKMTVNEVQALQGRMHAAGSPSTAVGGYQFMARTLAELKDKMGLKGDEIFDQQLQDRLADALLQRRGFGEFLKGKISHKDLVNNLAQEWAGLPTTEGKSFYEGDGLNHSQVKLRSVLDTIKEFRSNDG